MEYQTRFENEIAVVTIAGRLDGVTAPQCDQNIRELIEGAPAGLSSISARLNTSAAPVCAVFYWLPSCSRKRTASSIWRMSQAMSGRFDMSGFSNIFQITDSVAAALGKLQ